MSDVSVENGLRLFNAYTEVRPPRSNMGYDTAVVWSFLDELQRSFDTSGDVLEVGVRFGGSAMFELLMLRPGEKAYLVDMERTALFDKQLAKLQPAQQNNMEFFVMPSDDVRLEPLLARKYRWIHIDASHEYSFIKGDIERFSNCLAEDGVLVLDDFFQFAWPDVTTATYEFLASRPDWKMLFIGFNKAYLVRTAAKPRCMEAIKKDIGPFFETYGDFQIWTALSMRGDVVCSAKGFPTKVIDRTARRSGKEHAPGKRQGVRLRGVQGPVEPQGS